jgi:hypothetical protein
MTTANTLSWLVFGILAIVFMMSPMMLLVVFSFSEASVLSMPITGWTLDWYRRLFETDQFWVALENSLLVALTVGIVSTIVGTMAAFALLRVHSALRHPYRLGTPGDFRPGDHRKCPRPRGLVMDRLPNRGSAGHPANGRRRRPGFNGAVTR